MYSFRVISVTPRINLNSVPLARFPFDLKHICDVKISTLLLVDDGVIDAERFVSLNVVVELSVFVVAPKPVTTCKTRNAPRRSFIWVAVKVLPLTNDAGRFVGVAMVLLVEHVGPVEGGIIKYEKRGVAAAASDRHVPASRYDAVLDFLHDLVLSENGADLGCHCKFDAL